MIAELRLDRRLGVLALLQLEGGFGEFRHHLVLGEPAKIATGRLGSGIVALVLGDRGEVAALLQVGDHRFCLILGLHEDVLGVHLILRLLVLEELVVACLDLVIGDGGAHVAAQIDLLDDLVLRPLHALPARQRS